MSAGYRDPVEFYRAHASTFDRSRSREFTERPLLDALLAPHRSGCSVLDAGCGAGEPIAFHLAEAGCQLVGIDAVPQMLEMARGRVPGAEFLEADLRGFELGRTFDALVAWDSFFHLSAEEQGKALERFSRHLRPRATLLFNAGHVHGEAINPLYGEPLYHASLAPDEYRTKLEALGFSVLYYAEQDPAYGQRTIWLAGRGLEEE